MLFEAIYSHITGKEAAWGNTGAIGKGSKDELYNLVVVILLADGVIGSVYDYIKAGAVNISNYIPLWGFGAIMWNMYWPFVRVSIQEFLGYSYSSMHGGLWFNWISGAAIMSFTVGIQAAHDALNEKEESDVFK